MTDIAKPMLVRVGHDGELVELAIGPLNLSLEFDLALRVSAMLLVEGRVARRIALSKSATLLPAFRAGSILVDLNAAKKRRSRFQRLAERLRARDVRVENRGRVVAVRFGGNAMELPWEAALSIAQLLRLHGKMARNNAGESGGWQKIAATG